ncbi:MAG: hypothetical protein GX137_03785 [Thermoplasmatales archaeon]|jgi:uncharacterized membrane protein HdeD (DUF308 family)|nr:hypothetical protein [Thermoplasmatales archaeon]
MKRVALSLSVTALVLGILLVGTPAAALTDSDFSFPDYSVTDFLDDAVSIFSELSSMGTETFSGLVNYVMDATFLNDAPLYSIFNIYFIVCLAFVAFTLLAALISAGIYAKKKGS